MLISSSVNAKKLYPVGEHDKEEPTQGKTTLTSPLQFHTLTKPSSPEVSIKPLVLQSTLTTATFDPLAEI